MEEEKLGCFGHTWNLLWLVYLILSILFAWWAFNLSEEPYLLRLGAIFTITTSAIGTVYQVYKKKPDGFLRAIRHEFFITRKYISGSAIWVVNRVRETIEQITQKQTEELKQDNQARQVHIQQSIADVKTEMSAFQNMVSEGLGGNQEALNQLATLVQDQPDKIANILNNVLENELEKHKQDRNEYAQQLNELLSQQNRSVIDKEKDSLRQEIILVFVKFRDQFARTKDKQNVEILNQLRLEMLDISQKSEVYFQDDLKDINHEIWSVYLELVIAIDRHERQVLAPEKTKEQWEDRIYGKVNEALYSRIHQAVENLKQRMKKLTLEEREIEQVDLAALQELWKYLRFEIVHGILQGYADEQVFGEFIGELDVYFEVRKHPKYQLYDTSLEKKLSDFDDAMQMTLNQGGMLFGPPYTWTGYYVPVYRNAKGKSWYSESYKEFQVFIEESVRPTYEKYQALTNELKNRRIYHKLTQ